MGGIDSRMETANVLNEMTSLTDMSAAILVETGNGKRLNLLICEIFICRYNVHTKKCCHGVKVARIDDTCNHHPRSK